MDFSKIYQNLTAAVNTLGIKEIKECPYNCTFKGTQMELNEHMYDNAKDHMQSIISDMEQKMNQMEENILNQTREMIYLLSNEINILKKECAISQTIPSAPPEIIYPTCPLVWEIPEFPTKLALAQSKPDKKSYYYSQPFYLFKEGYFASLKLFPNGDGVGKGRFLGVFIVLRKGIYDEVLNWPFRNNISIKITPGKDKWNEGHGDTFTADPKQSAFQKPITEMNTGSGISYFIKIEDVIKDYVINNSIFIEIRCES